MLNSTRLYLGEALNEQLKQRLVGAVVLISLAVIFIPMLLEGDRPAQEQWGSAVPPRPEMRFEPLEIPLRTPVAPEPAAVSVIETPRPEHIPDPAELPKPVQETAQETVQPANPGESRPGPHAWVIQVGSFSNSANALLLRDRLRKKGFAAFVQETKGEPTVYRVKVGPELQREAAEKLKGELMAKLQLSAIVVQHP